MTTENLSFRTGRSKTVKKSGQTWSRKSFFGVQMLNNWPKFEMGQEVLYKIW